MYKQKNKKELKVIFTLSSFFCKPLTRIELATIDYETIVLPLNYRGIMRVNDEIRTRSCAFTERRAKPITLQTPYEAIDENRTRTTTLATSCSTIKLL